MQTKKTFLKTLLFFYLIPHLAVLLLTALDCVVNLKYLEWYWLKEWMVVLPETVAYYLLLVMDSVPSWMIRRSEMMLLLSRKP